VEGNATLSDKWSIVGGVRYEDVASYYTDKIDATNNVRRHYRNLYPSFSITHKGDHAWSNTLSFSSRVSRPTFKQLSNSNYYINEFMYQRGNPLLKPSMSYIVQWNSGYKIVNFSASYTYQKNYISADFTMPDNNPNLIISSHTNYRNIQYFKANVNIRKNISIWKPSLTLGILQPFFKATYMGNTLKHNRAQLYAVLNQYLQLPRGYLISAYYYYMNGGNQGALLLKSYQTLNLTVQRAFFNDRLSVALNAQDIFHTMKFRETERINNISFRQTEDYSLWNYSISLQFRLNKTKTKYRGENTVKEDINRLQ
jgi:hypothetical protein